MKVFLVWTAHSIVLLAILGDFLQENYHRKFETHVQTDPMEQLIPTREAYHDDIMRDFKH